MSVEHPEMDEASPSLCHLSVSWQLYLLTRAGADNHERHRGSVQQLYRERGGGNSTINIVFNCTIMIF